MFSIDLKETKSLLTREKSYYVINLLWPRNICEKRASQREDSRTVIFWLKPVTANIFLQGCKCTNLWCNTPSVFMFLSAKDERILLNLWVLKLMHRETCCRIMMLFGYYGIICNTWVRKRFGFHEIQQCAYQGLGKKSVFCMNSLFCIYCILG